MDNWLIFQLKNKFESILERSSPSIYHIDNTDRH